MEEIITINGGRKLYGDVLINGMKNAALPIISACVLNKETCIIDNIPPVSDVETLLDILACMGAKVRMLTKYTVEINCKNIDTCSAPDSLASKLRGSSYLLGAGLGRSGKSSIYSPGGCSIGARPLDLHMMSFEALGAKTSHVDDKIVVEAKEGLNGTVINFDKTVSVGATVNAILASVLANGTTTIKNAACEPHVVDLAVFLNACGAKIIGAGTSTIRIKGVTALHGCRYSVAPDMIEAGTYMVAAATAGGKVTVRNIIPKHLTIIIEKLEKAGANITVGDDWVTVESNCRLKPISITTAPYPGFATDMQPQFGAMLCFADGVSDIKEDIFENRLLYTGELVRMGAEISVSKQFAVVRGGTKLHGAKVECKDLRAGAAMIIAALAADGKSEISGIDKIERGYYNIVGKLSALGADIQKKFNIYSEMNVAVQ